jgi:hypothetical protein
MRRSFLALLFIAAVLLAGATPSVVATVSPARSIDKTPARAQNSGLDRNSSPVAGTPVEDMRGSDQIDPLTFYESPTFGYVIPWFEDIWHLESSDTGSDGDLQVFRREDDVITFHGYEGDAGDPDACLSRLTDQLDQSSDADLQLGVDFDGNRMEGEDEFHAWAVYVMAAHADADGAQPESVWHLECRRLVPGSAVLAITLVMTRDRYDFLIDSAYDFMDWVVMPRVAYDLDEAEGQPVLVGLDLNVGLECFFPRNPRLLVDGNGEEAGMATLVQNYDPNSEGAWHLYVRFENTGADDLRVDPLAIEVNASSQTGEDEISEDTLRPTDYRWETGDGDLSEQVQVLAPGKRMIVRLTFAEPFFDGTPPSLITVEAVYETEQTSSVTIGEWGDCAGGAGRPRLGG